MGEKINDEFSDLPFSRQYLWQLRKKKEGNCIICGEPSISANHCMKHHVVAREAGFKAARLKKGIPLEEPKKNRRPQKYVDNTSECGIM
jgi:hypothetical protein